MRHFTYLLLAGLAAGLMNAQPTVAPTPDQAGPPQGDNVGDYNITQSFELGYRFATVGGDLGMYKSVVNYSDGVRLLSSSLAVDSKDGHGRLFDHLVLSTQGLGNDPYQFASLRIDKNKLYRYDLIWRQSNFFDPAITTALGEHALNTQRSMQDHDFTLFPQSSLKFFLGYSRNVDTGPALTSVQLFTTGLNTNPDTQFPLFANLREQQNEYRLGFEGGFAGWRLNFMHGWEDYKQDQGTVLLAPEQSPGAALPGVLNSFDRTEPYHGTSPYYRVGLFHSGSKWWAFNGRFSYVAGNRGFSYFENAAGALGGPGALITEQTIAAGNAKRPAATGNVNLTFFPTDKITITNQTSYYNIRTEGDSEFAQYFLGSAVVPVLQYTFLGIRTIANSTDAEIRVRKWFAVHGGYQYSDRRISVVDSQQQFGLPAPTAPANTPFIQTNILQEGTLGFRIHPVKALTIVADGEIGRNNHPYTPISDKDYQAFRARAEYKQRNYRIQAYAKTDYNNNSISLTSFASRSRTYGADAAWTPNEWFTLDAGYSKMHVNTLGGLDFFVTNTLTTGESLYISNIHTATLMARFAIGKRAEISVGYSHVQDVGDGRSTAIGAAQLIAIPAFQAAQTFPLRFDSPQARLSIMINRRMRWNAGYQYYGYHEQFSSLQDFRAQTGYSSLSFAF